MNLFINLKKPPQSEVPKISVLMPLYNAQSSAEEAISSVLSQSFEDFELLICDDGSTDSSIYMLNQYTDRRVRIIRNEARMGIPFTRNRLLDEAIAPFIAWIDADDIFFPDKLKKQYEYLNRNPNHSFCICYAWANVFGKWKKKSFPSSVPLLNTIMLFKTPFGFPGVMMRKTNLRFNTEFSRCQDFDMLYRLMQTAPPLVLKERLVVYRTLTESDTKPDTEKTNVILNQILKNKLSELNIFPDERTLTAINTICRDIKKMSESELNHAIIGLENIAQTTTNKLIIQYLNYLLLKCAFMHHIKYLKRIKRVSISIIFSLIRHKI